MLYLLDRLTNDDKHRESLRTEVGVVHIHVDRPVGQPAQGDQLIFEFPPRDQLSKDGGMLAKYHTSNPRVHVPRALPSPLPSIQQGPRTDSPC